MSNNPYESPEHPTNLSRRASFWPTSPIEYLVLLGLFGLLCSLVMPRHFLSWGSREAARRLACSNNLHNIALALRSYESNYHSLPPAYTVDAEDKPLHSWRTLLLPYLDQKQLYKQIDLSKPWDDPANKLAYDTPLKIYECPSNTIDRSRAMTTYLAVVAPGGCFRTAGCISLDKITDDRGCTLLVLEVSPKHAVHWMSPHDATEETLLNREADDDFAHPGGSQAAFADGGIRFLTNSSRPEALRAMISINGNDDNMAGNH